MATQPDFANRNLASLSDEALAEQRMIAREQVYARAGQLEEPAAFTDPLSGGVVRLRPSEWRLVQLDRELQRRTAKNATVTAAAAAHLGATSESVATERAPDGVAGRHRLVIAWTAAALAVGLLVGIAGTLTATETLRVPGFAPLAPDAAAPPASTTPTPLPLPSEHSTVLRVFARDGRLEESIPSMLKAVFPPDGIATVYFPKPGNTGTRIYAARPDAKRLCLVVVSPAEEMTMSCDALDEVATHGLTLRFWLADGLQQAPSLLGDNVDTPPTMAAVSWNSDGTFSITQQHAG